MFALHRKYILSFVKKYFGIVPKRNLTLRYLFREEDYNTGYDYPWWTDILAITWYEFVMYKRTHSNKKHFKTNILYLDCCVNQFSEKKIIQQQIDW